ncbi:MAG: AsmA-like C-terminal region-containing protein [Planctomycetia bacterium]
MNALTDSLWTLVRWAVPVTVAGVIAAGVIGASRIGDQVRTRVEARLAEEFPGMVVRVEAASLLEGEGIVLRGLSLVDPTLPQQWRQLLWIDEVHLACGTTLAELASGPPRITTVRVRRPVIHAARRQTGDWTIARLVAGRPAGTLIPIVIEDASLLIDDARLGTRIAMRQAAVELAPDDTAPGWATIRGSTDADLFDRGTFHGRIAPGGGGFELAGTIDGFDVSPRIAAAVAAATPRAADMRGAAVGLRGRLSLAWKAAGALNALDQVVFECSGRLDSGHLEHPKLPLVVSDMKATFAADRDGIRVEGLEGHSGSTLLRGSGRLAGWGTDGDFDLLVEAERLAVGRHWEGMLPEAIADQWQKLLPAGEVDVRAEVVRRGGTIDPRVSVRCRSVSLTHYRFPYRVDHTVGTVVFENRQLSLHLTGQAGGHPVQVAGALRFEPNAASGHVEVRGEGMQIDDSLLAAMPSQSADIVRSLRAAGTFDFVFRHERGPQLPGGRANSLGIRLIRCSMAYAGFPYPLTNVSGSIRMDRDHWTIRDIAGSNDAGVVRCSGSLTPRGDGDGELTLQLSGSGVVLERELRDALPSGMRQIWDDLDPRGSADFSATVRHHVKPRQTSVEVEAIPHGQTVSIEPAWFPYRLEQLTGKMVLKNGLLQFDGVRGVHDRTTVAAEGTCRFMQGGGWHVSFANLSADRFRADHEVVRALPPGLQRAIELVRPRGLLSLSGALDIASSPHTAPVNAPAVEPNAAGPSPAAAWDLVLDMEQGALDVGVPLEHVHGGVRLKGRSDGHAWQSTGEIAIDSAICRGVQMTGITGPLAMDADGVRFGMAAGGLETGRPRRLEAGIAGGTLAADGRMNADEAGTFAVALSLDSADFERLSGDALASSPSQRYRGRLSGFLELSGSRAGTHSLSGRGQMRLRDAAIYELPVVVSLLKVLRIKSPDRNAFGSSFVDFHIEGPHAYLDTIELSGDAISLVGAGEVDIDANVKLVFRSIMGDSEQQLPVLKRVLGGASGQFLLIHVDGTLAQPEVSTEAFPTLAAALQKLQSAQRHPDGLRNAAARREGRRDVSR